MRGVEADGNYALLNTAVGYGALGAVTDGTYNVCISNSAGDTIGNEVKQCSYLVMVLM